MHHLKMTTYLSGLLAFHHAHHFLRSPEEADQYMNDLWDVGTEDGGCDAMLLAEVVRAAGVACEALEIAPEDVSRTVLEQLMELMGALVQVRGKDDPSRVRWCITTDLDNDVVGMLAADDVSDPTKLAPSLAESATGQVVLIHERPPTAHMLVIEQFRANIEN